MRVALISVPHTAPFSPLLGAPMVAGGLAQRGHETVVIDAGLLAMEQLWSAPALARGVEFLRETLARHERHDQLSRSAARDYLDAARQVLGADVVAGAVESALALLRGAGKGEGLGEGDEYDRALLTLEAALSLSSAPFAPERLSLRSYHPAPPQRTESELLAYARRPAARALFGATLLDQVPALVLEAFAGHGPDAVGVSIAWPAQLGPAAMLGQGLRAAGFEGPIVWGGALMAHLGEELSRCAELGRARLTDAVVPLGGAEVLATYLESALAGEREASPGVLIPGAPAPDPEPEHEPPAVDEGELPLPSFSDLPLGRYLSPRPVLPLLASIGCYWQRCAFCDHFHSVRRYRLRPVARVVEEMRALHQETGCQDFYLVDDCTPPRTMDELADALLSWRERGGPALRWLTECRAERALLEGDRLERMAASGCRMLLFGMESASDRVLEAMEKGATREQLAAVLAAVHDAGILTWCFYMFGFPGETPEDAQETLDFLVAQREVIDAVAGGPFVVTRHSPIARDPARFALTIEPPPGAPSRKHRKKRRGGAPAVLPADLQLTRSHRHGSTTTAQQQRALRAVLEHDQLQHYRHPLVAEVHGLFLERGYYRGQTADGAQIRDRGARPARADLLASTVSAAADVAVQYFKFPTAADQLPTSGKIKAGANAVLSRLGHSPLHVSVPIGALLERCLEGAATVAARARETEARGEGTESDVVEAVTELLRAGYLLTDDP